MALLKLDNLSVNERLNAFTEQVNYGERVHLIGANGAGKSTLLMAIAGELQFNGEIILNETSIRYYKYDDLSRMQSIVIQQLEALSFMSVFHYLSLYHKLSKMDVQQLNMLLNDFKIDKLLSKNIHHLSGGEWQRVRIVGAFIQLWSSYDLKGKLMLLDEPTNNLDVVQLAILDKWVDKFCQQGGAVIMSTHNLNHSYQKADRVWLIKNGYLVDSGVPALLLDEKLLSTTFNTNIKCINDVDHIDWRVLQ
ncbi:vitamin B12 ABC transporter ATP-binding protein BtuD [Proteus appendicitidis]|uniref:ATP-binding cassette domain-containing protein n=1 Tax=Proteus appendicitidis TaxID=3034648 RepID=A0ABY8YCP8_9GAMM|nr:ATP-binding cassette domain-containing protein [Proteus sp. HZ0627]WIV89889.1 ATP-binding cassette domain-containing protein [Proteus sp. HZ0627]